MAACLFYLFSVLAIVFSAMVVVLRNPIPSALSLVASFFSVSVLFVLLHAPFLGVIQVLIYAGAILVLFLYVLMLLDLRKERLGSGGLERTLRFAALAVVPLVLMWLLPFLNLSDEAVQKVEEGFGSVGSVGKALLGPYALAFELVSLVLLAAILGTVVLAARRKEEGP